MIPGSGTWFFQDEVRNEPLMSRIIPTNALPIQFFYNSLLKSDRGLVPLWLSMMNSSTQIQWKWTIKDTMPNVRDVSLGATWYREENCLPSLRVYQKIQKCTAEKKTMRNGNIIIKLNSILQQWFEAFRTILLWRSNLSFYGFSRNVQWCFSVSLVSAHESTDILMTICVPEFPQPAFQQPLRKQPGGTYCSKVRLCCGHYI